LNFPPFPRKFEGEKGGHVFNVTKKSHKLTKSGFSQSELNSNEEKNIPCGWWNREAFGIA